MKIENVALALSVELKKNSKRKRNEDILQGCFLDNDNFLGVIFKVADYNLDPNVTFNVEIWQVGSDYTTWVPAQWIRKARDTSALLAL